ncbi:MAG: type II toxin-antitoxin system PemK/MazF family toxin [Candidatus Uhrbacteria bacterium]
MLEQKEILERFVGWTKLKIKIHFSQRRIFPKEREIWWVSLGQNIGVEINGKNENFERPVLVVKKYSLDSVLVLPISSRSRDNQYCFDFINNNKNGSINFSQVKSISTKRFIRRLDKMDSVVYQKIKEKLKETFK